MLKQWRGRYFALAVGISILVVTGPCWADDLSDQPFEVRLWLAMSRAVSSTDAIGREASVAYRSASSDNPAAADVRGVEPVNERGFLCAGTHNIIFSDGAWIAAGDVNGFIRLKNTGTVALGYIHIGLPDGTTREGFNDDLRSNQFIMKYGRQIHPDVYVGAGFRVSDLRLNYGDLFMGAPRSTQDHSISGSFTLGAQWRPNPNWTLGALAGEEWIRSDIGGLVHLPGPFDAPFQFDLTTRTTNVKAGFGWRAAPALTIYGDVQYFRIDNSMTGVDTGRFYLGADMRVSRRVSLMAGSSVDTGTHVSAGSGLSIKLLKPGVLRPTLLKVTYQYNPLPEIRREFGTGNLVSATMVFSF